MQMYASAIENYERRQAVHKEAIVDMTRSFLKLQQMNLPIDDEHDVFLIEDSPNKNVSVMIGCKESFLAPGGVSALPCHRQDYTKDPRVQCILNDIATTYAKAKNNKGSASFGYDSFPVSRIRNDERHIYNLARNILGVCY